MRWRSSWLLLLLAGCVGGRERVPTAASVRYDATGVASWYGQAFAGRATASGERFDPGEMTAAHRTLPFGTIVAVTVLSTGRTALVRINDRGPGRRERIIDLSQGAARLLRIERDPARVRVRAVAPSARPGLVRD